MNNSEYRKKQENAEQKRRESAEDAYRNKVISALQAISEQNKASDYQTQRADRFHRLVEKLTLRLEGRKFWVEIAETAGLWFAAAVGVAAIIIASHDAGEQREVMQGQLTEMRGSALQTSQLVGANAKLAEAAAKQALAAEKQATAMADAAKAARDNLIASERAWIGPRNASFEKALEVGKPISVILEYVNTGHEPGQNFVYSIDGFPETDVEDKDGTAFKKMTDFFAGCKRSKNTIVGQVVFPTAGFSSYNLGMTIKGEAVTQDLIDGNTTFIIQGCFLYESFNVPRHTYFCYFYNGKTTKITNLKICNIGHFAD